MALHLCGALFCGAKLVEVPSGFIIYLPMPFRVACLRIWVTQTDTEPQKLNTAPIVYILLGVYIYYFVELLRKIKVKKNL